VLIQMLDETVLRRRAISQSTSEDTGNLGGPLGASMEDIADGRFSVAAHPGRIHREGTTGGSREVLALQVVRPLF
jgi:hypothetical protein